MQMEDHHDLKPGLWRLFSTWASIGLQSFGGGASTSYLIQDTFVNKRGWLTMEDYTHLWNLCVFTPGINLIALTILIGRRLGGFWGIFISLCGMLVPSAAITCLLAAGFKEVQNVPAVQAILKGVIPATAGIMLLVGLRFAHPLVLLSKKEGLVSLLAGAMIVLVCTITIIIFKIPVILVLPCAALAGVALFTPWRNHNREEGQ